LAVSARLCVPGPGPYLLTHSVGCLPVTAEAALRSTYLEPWRAQGGDAWPRWLEAVGEFRAALAELLGGAASEYCPQPNLSAALAKLVPALPYPDHRRVWLAAEESFPSLGFVLQRAEKLGFSVRLLPRARDPGHLEMWVDALTEDVCAVLVTHVHSSTGIVAPVADIARVCRAHGVLCVIDVAQSAGILPLRVDTLGADALLGSCIKWLCGGPGAGFVWVRPGLVHSLSPIDVGWFSHVDPFAMDIHDFRFAEDARRLWGGTPSIAPYVIATAGLRLINEIGVETIRRHNRDLMREFLEAAPATVGAAIDLEGIGGTLCLPAGGDFEAVSAALKALGARFDTRGPRVRLSFHLCNDAEDARCTGRAWPR
jgi:kynureninase